MSEGAGAPAPASAPSPGRLLREAREKQGLHIAALAAAIKVAPKKLESLESDRFDELPDATFTRALAQTVCRALKTDPGPVMRLLPPPLGHRLEHVGEGLNTPFRERPGALVQSDWPQFVANPAFWLTALLLVAAVAVYFLPASLTGLSTGRVRPASAPRVGVEPGMPPEASVEAPATPASAASGSSVLVAAGAAAEAASIPAPASAPGVPAADAGTSVADAAPAAAPVASAPDALPPGMLQLRAVAESWVEVTDARGQPLVSRLLKAGESVGIDGTPPLRVRIGNAGATQLVFRGQATDLRAFTRDNVARLELR
ncbi:MAG: helix-turn-helix domain-containing protein [Caldimonas sp.]